MGVARPLIENVSDTARWVAIYRAIESERPDALFHDSYARALAGEQGQSIVDGLPGADNQGWPIVVRTAVFDEIIQRAVEKDGVDLVLDLAAGLDSRPYRLPLPATLKWVEIDLPGIIEHKDRVLKDAKASCQVTRLAVDLSDVTARRKAFESITADAKCVFVLTEGLLMYLTAPQVASLASDLAELKRVRFWGADLIGPAVRLGMHIFWYRTLKAANSSFHFAPRNGAEFFRPYGWAIHDYRAQDAEMVRLNRLPGYAFAWKYAQRFQTAGMRELSRRSASFVVLEKPWEAP